MKTPAQLVERCLLSAADHKKRATAIKRVAGGIRTEIASATTAGLSEADITTLKRAEAILGNLATLYSRAGKLRQSHDDTLQRAITAVKAAMATTFGQLTSVADRVAFIGAADSFQLRHGRVKSPSDLSYYFDDAMSSLAYRLGREAISQKQTPAAVVAAAWQKFDGGKAELQGRYRDTISSLSADT